MKIILHAAAPAKPPVGSPCNGCAVCCSIAPCPLSCTLLGHREGACPALAWQTDRYVCGLATEPARHLRWLPGFLTLPARRFALRWIAAGGGCDCAAEVEKSAD